MCSSLVRKFLAVIRSNLTVQFAPIHPVRILLALSLFCGLSATAGAEEFDLPIDCKLGTTCWIMNYPDHQPGPGVADSACGPRSYDGHKGTDFAVRDLRTMRSSVAVRTIATGTVLRLRNSVPDHGLSFSPDRIKGRECGNGVVIRHAKGWESQYCHLRRGSVRVKPGDHVARGTALGEVGMSGRTAFPHVHLSLRKDGQLVDPVGGRKVGKGCGTKGKSLFRSATDVRYHRSRLYAAGFAAEVPTGARIKGDAGSPKSIARNAPAFVFWAAIFGAAKGSRVQLTITRPDGSEFIARDIAITRDQAWRTIFIGRKRKAEKDWPSGRYRGTAKLHSIPGARSASQTVQISVDIP